MGDCVMSKIVSLFGDLSTPESAARHTKSIAEQVMELTSPVQGSKAAAQAYLSDKYQLGSFIKKLLSDESVAIVVDRYVRLCIALEDQIKIQEQRLADKRRLLELLGDHDAAHLGDISTDLERDQIHSNGLAHRSKH